MNDPATLHIGDVLGQYRVVRQLGEGGQAQVFAAEHERLGRAACAAIKVLLPLHRANAELSARFFNEARAASLVSHPGVVRVIDFGHAPGDLPYITMEYLCGESLFERLRRQGPDAPQRSVRLLRQVAATMAAVHALGIVHRDLKPANILIVPDPEVEGGERTKVVDFGIAKLQPEHYHPDITVLQTALGRVMGTPWYMSPEQCGGAEELDDRSDVYSLGVIAYELLAGRPPFQDLVPEVVQYRQLHDAPEPLRSHCPRLPAGLTRLVDGMLDKMPNRRPAMREVVELLTPFESAALVAAPGPLLQAPAWHAQTTLLRYVPTSLTALVASVPRLATYRARWGAALGIGLGLVLLALLLGLGLR